MSVAFVAVPGTECGQGAAGELEDNDHAIGAPEPVPVLFEDAGAAVAVHTGASVVG